MTQEDKELLLKDLCARLPYRLKALFVDSNSNDTLQSIWWDELEGWQVDGNNLSAPLYSVKPYLFPISSMTEEQVKDLTKFVANGIHDENIVYDWYNKNHIDYRGLIPMGLANDATGLNIY